MSRLSPFTSVLIAGLMLASLPVFSNPAAAAEGEAPLARALRERFEVLPIRGGVVLRPLAERSDIVGIEISEGEVAVDGETVEAQSLPELIGEPEASLLLRLVDLDEEELRALFAPPAPPLAPGAPPVDPIAPVEPTAPVPGVAPVPSVAPPAPPAPSGLRRGGSKVVFGSTAVVEADEDVDEVVSIGGSARVHGRVRGDVVAVGGSVEVEGRVDGEVVAVGGPVSIGPEARVRGEITSVGSTVTRAQGAETGPVNEVTTPWFGGPWNWGAWDGNIAEEIIEEIHKPSRAEKNFSQFSSDLEELVHRVVFLVALWLMGALAALVAPRSFKSTADAIGAAPIMAPVVGLLTALLFFPLVAVVTVLLVISIVGIPLVLLVPFALVAFVVLWLFGLAAAVARVGSLLESRLGRSGVGQPIALALGLVLLGGFGVAAHLIDLADGRSDLLGVLSGLLGFTYFCAMAWAWFAGLGGLLLARFQPATPVPPAWAVAPVAWPPAGAAAVATPMTPEPSVGPSPVPRWSEDEFLAAAEEERQRAAESPAATDDDGRYAGYPEASADSVVEPPSEAPLSDVVEDETDERADEDTRGTRKPGDAGE